MINDLKPYPEMKDSGVPWLGDVPEHWEVLPLRRNLRPYDGIKIGPFGSQLKLEQLSDSGFKVYGQANVIANDFSRGKKFIDEGKFNELSTCRLRTDDLVVTMMGTSGRCARIPSHAVPGIMDSHLLRLRTIARIDRTFAALIIDKAPYIKDQIAVAGKGSIMHGLNSGMIKDLIFAVPSLPEQNAIVRFLDHANRHIRRYTHAKQKLIKLLEEQKQAMIQCAVARGLDRNVQLKCSMVEWLGDVPEHWEVCRLKSLVKESVAGPYGSSLTKAMYTSTGYRVYGQQQVIPGDFTIGDYYISSEKFEEMKQYRVLPGDVLVSVMGTVGRAAVVPGGVAPGIINPRLVRYHPNHVRVRSPYFCLAINSPQSRAQIIEAAKGTTMEGLNMQILGRLMLAIPPLIEQDEIVATIQAEGEILRRAILSEHSAMQLINEYHTRLIADVVTGKLDVREAAARLPETNDEFESIEESEQFTGLNEYEDTDIDEAHEEVDG